MTEHSDFGQGLPFTERIAYGQVLAYSEPSLNGHGVASEPDAPPVPEAHVGSFVDVERGVFVTSRGEDIELSGKRVSSLMLERLLNEGKPRIPMKEVLILGKHKQMEAAPNDPGYLAMMAEWESNQKIASLIYLFAIGIKGKPDAEFIDEQRFFFPDASDATMKYLWTCFRLPDEDIDKLAEAIIGQSMPTSKGLKDAADSFPLK